MFGTKKELRKLEDRVERLFNAITYLEEKKTHVVFCEECGVAIKKEKAQEVNADNGTKFYCDKHKKPYNKIRLYRDFSTLMLEAKYYKNEGETEVDEKGKVIK